MSDGWRLCAKLKNLVSFSLIPAFAIVGPTCYSWQGWYVQPLEGNPDGGFHKNNKICRCAKKIPSWHFTLLEGLSVCVPSSPMIFVFYLILPRRWVQSSLLCFQRYDGFVMAKADPFLSFHLFYWCVAQRAQWLSRLSSSRRGKRKRPLIDAFQMKVMMAFWQNS